MTERKHSKLYTDYLGSKEWAQKRKEKLGQVGYVCEYKGNTFYNSDGTPVECCGALQVHHNHYRTLGKEYMHDLSVACEAHHHLLDTICRGKQ